FRAAANLTPSLMLPVLPTPRASSGRRDRPRRLALNPAKPVTRRIRCQCLTMGGGAIRTASAGVFPGSSGDGYVKARSGVEWRPTGQVGSTGLRRHRPENQIARGVSPVDFGRAGRLKCTSLFVTVG